VRMAVFVCGGGASASKRAVSERTIKPGGKAFGFAWRSLRPEGETLGGEGRERDSRSCKEN